MYTQQVRLESEEMSLLKSELEAKRVNHFGSSRVLQPL